MKKISYAAYENSILLSHPNAKIEVRDGVEVVVIPTWDFNTDQSGEHVYELVRDGGERAPKFQPGDVLRHTETGVPMNVVDPLAAMMSVRKGPKVEFPLPPTITCCTCDTRHSLLESCPGCGGGPAPYLQGKPEDYPYWGMTREQVLAAKAAEAKSEGDDV